MSPKLKDYFRQFIRNEQWGTCGDCPRHPTKARVYPERCKYWERYDHRLDINALLHQWNIEVKDRIKEKGPLTLVNGNIYKYKITGELVEFQHMGQTGLAICCEPGDSGGGMQSLFGVKPEYLEKVQTK